MPRKPLKPCAVNGCPNLTDKTYCEFHRKQRNISYSRFDRDKEMQLFYKSKAWRMLRASYLEEHPLCEECQRNGRLKPAEMVDHIVPIKQGGEPLDTSNLQALCWSCHSIKSHQDGSMSNTPFKRTK